METVWLDAKKSNMCGASIGSGGKGMSRACEISAVGSCSEASGWEFESVPYDVSQPVPALHSLSLKGEVACLLPISLR